MAAKLNLKPVPQALSPQRQRLQEAITRRDKLKNRLGNLEQASLEMMRSSWQLADDLSAANATLTELENAATEALISKHVEGSDNVSSGKVLEQQHQCIVNISDMIETTGRARQHVSIQIITVKKDLEYCDSDIQSAITAVTWSDSSVKKLLSALLAATKRRAELYEAVKTLGSPPPELMMFTRVNPDFDDTLAGEYAAVLAKLHNDAACDFPTE
jgi:chromosome segregation ATPase